MRCRSRACMPIECVSWSLSGYSGMHSHQQLQNLYYPSPHTHRTGSRPVIGFFLGWRAVGNEEYHVEISALRWHTWQDSGWRCFRHRRCIRRCPLALERQSGQAHVLHTEDTRHTTVQLVVNAGSADTFTLQPRTRVTADRRRCTHVHKEHDEIGLSCSRWRK